MQLPGREGGDDLAHGARDLDLFEGMGLDYTLGIEPREEDAQAARIAVDAVARERLFALRGEAVAGVAFFLLQVTDEGLYRPCRNFRDTG